MYEVILIVASTLFALLAWRDLRFALVLLAGLLPTYLLRFSIGPVPGTLLEVCILLAVAVWLVRHHNWRLDLRRIDRWTHVGLLVLAAASFGVVVAPDTIGAFGIWKAYFVEPFLVFVMMRSLFKQGDWYKALIALAVSSIAVSAFALFQFATGLAIPVPWDIERRVTSLFDYPNAVGLFVAPMVTVSLLLSVQKQQPARWFWITSAVFGCAAIVVAQTEAALVAVPAALIVTLLLSRATVKKKRALAFLGIALLLTALVVPFSRSKILLQDYSGGVRLAQWTETLQMLAHNPAFGAGLNAYPQTLEAYHDGTLYEIFQYPHNIILNIWSELGLLGLLALLSLGWLAIAELRTLDRLQHHVTALKQAAFAALLTMTIHGLVDVPYFKNDLAVMTWIFIAILAAHFDNKKQTR